MKQNNVYGLIAAGILFLAAHSMDGASFGYQPAPAVSQGSTASNEVAETANVALASSPEPGTLSIVVLGGLLVVFGVGFKRKD